MIAVPLAADQFDTAMQLVFALGGVAFGWACARWIIDLTVAYWSRVNRG